MKKILKIITIIMTFFVTTKTCFAYNINQGNPLKDMKVHIKTLNYERNININQIISENPKDIIYNITPEITPNNTNFKEYDYNKILNTVSEDVYNQIAIITYYGYGYANRTDIKWYGITQYLIWSELLKDKGEIYFVDDSNNKVDLYQNEIQDMLDDVQHYTDFPSFINYGHYGIDYDIKFSETLTLEDSNNILKDFCIEPSIDYLDYTVENNKLIITPKEPNLGFLMFYRNLPKLEDNMKLYTDNASESYIKRGNIDKHIWNITINVEAPLVAIKNTSNKNSSLSLEGAEYTYYTAEGNVYWTNIKLNKDGISKGVPLMPGKYYIVEEKNAYGYEPNKEKIYFEVKKEDVTINISNIPLKKSVTIERHLINNNGEIVLEPNAKMSVYDSNNNLIKELVTNKLGQANIDLTYGTYKIIDSNSRERNTNFAVTFTIDSNFNEKEAIIIESKSPSENNPAEIIDSEKNNETQIENQIGTIIINKIDALTKKPLKGIKFGLYNANKELIDEAATDTEGKIIFKDLVTGKYYIKELLTEDNKNIDESAIEVEVKANINTILTSPNRTKINVPNTFVSNHNLTIIISCLTFIIGLILIRNPYIKYAKIK